MKEYGGITEIKTPLVNDVFDRFQTQANIGGSYGSPVASNESVYTIEARALKENYQQISQGGGTYYYFKFKITNPSQTLKFEYGEAMPWFGKPGGAIQIKTNLAFHEITNQIEVLEKWQFINGNWIRL